MLGALQFILGICALLLRFSILIILCFSTVTGAAPHFVAVGKCSLQPYSIPDVPNLYSCETCEIDDAGIMSCSCVDLRGQVVTSSLPIYSCPKHYAYPLCAGPIEIIDGKLSCRKISAESTYELGCFSCEKIGSVLRCECYKEKRVHESSLLDLSTCKRPISNCNGQLTCGLCAEPQINSWTWFYGSLIGAAAAGTGMIVFRLFFWKFFFG